MASPILLCIDDRAQLLQLRKISLEPLGYSVATAASAPAAMAVLEHTPVAVVLLDYKSEGMDAEALAYLVKQRFPRQPIVLLSAYSEMPQRVLWLVDEYVMRSDPRERLAEAIRRATSGKAARRDGGLPHRKQAGA